jgi:selenide,water dikinase
LPGIDDPSVLVDAGTHDDAAVYKLDDKRAMVATVDFFTPIVDDPYTFGAIAAANALSDVYAMGARPLIALNLVGWPRDEEMLALLAETIRGGADKVAESGAFIVGGHTIDDKEPKYGLVAIGEVHPDRILSCGNARPGDSLVLTKPLGTGILSTALKKDLISETEMAMAIKSMSTLNSGAAAAVETLHDSVSGATDVTGFGLLGHLKNLLGDSAGARIDVARLPVFEKV